MIAFSGWEFCRVNTFARKWALSFDWLGVHHVSCAWDANIFCPSTLLEPRSHEKWCEKANNSQKWSFSSKLHYKRRSIAISPCQCLANSPRQRVVILIIFCQCLWDWWRPARLSEQLSWHWNDRFPGTIISELLRNGTNGRLQARFLLHNRFLGVIMNCKWGWLVKRWNDLIELNQSVSF